MIVPVEPLRSILRLEQKRQYDDGAVIGGIDAFIRRWVADVSQQRVGPGFLERLKELQLTRPDYAAWDTEKRRRWVEQLLAWLDVAEEEAQRSLAAASAVATASRSKKAPRQVNKTAGLDSPITSLGGVATGISSKLARLGVRTIRDMLYFFPRRHVDYSNRRFIADLKEGEEQTIIATVWQAEVEFLGGRRGTVAIVGDETGNMRVVWFNQPYLAERLRSNSRIALSGRVSVYHGIKQFESPEWEFIGDADEDLLHTGRLVPVYPLTQGLFPKQVRRLVKVVVDGWAERMTDFMPGPIRDRCRLAPLSWAIRQAHFPDSLESLNDARRRLAFDELFLFQMNVLGRKREWQEGQPGNPIFVDRVLVDRLIGSLPFSLTGAQVRALDDILADIQKPRAMNRLLQGEVGSGKTVVALYAALAAVANKKQVAIMAPTEVLARQHFDSIERYLKGSRVRRTVLTGSTTSLQRKEILNAIRSGNMDIVVGTVALLHRDVRFANLALIIIDEQHKFGVHQRAQLRKG
ncbi:MAG: DEAD/DEAH box helicase, partial [Dehalococcoidia bacterium]|nr:DEAD/DEAH box helicase [Dehalococcoidia bacterium]